MSVYVRYMCVWVLFCDNRKFQSGDDIQNTTNSKFKCFTEVWLKARVTYVRIRFISLHILSLSSCGCLIIIMLSSKMHTHFKNYAEKQAVVRVPIDIVFLYFAFVTQLLCVLTILLTLSKTNIQHKQMNKRIKLRHL